MERDEPVSLAQSVVIISTHTLTWSVTAYSFYRSAAWKISTHTLTWSVTLSVSDPKPYADNFNSHAHVERDELQFVT